MRALGHFKFAGPCARGRVATERNSGVSGVAPPIPNTHIHTIEYPKGPRASCIIATVTPTVCTDDNTKYQKSGLIVPGMIKIKRKNILNLIKKYFVG